MELVLALAVVAVAAATLFLAYAGRRRFEAHQDQLNQVGQDVAIEHQNQGGYDGYLKP